MNVASLLSRCARSGVRLFVGATGRLRYEAPGGLDPSLKADLTAHREQLVRHFIRPAVEASTPQPLTVMTVEAGVRTIIILPAGALVPPNCVLYMVGTAAYWTPGPAHALG